MLSPEEIKAARQQYGLDKPKGSTTGGSPFQTGQQKPDHTARMERLRGLTTQSSSEKPSQEEGGGFLSKVGNFFKSPTAIANLVTQGPAGLLTEAISQHPKETAEAGVGMVKNFGKAAVQLTAQNPAIAEAAGAIGGEEAKGKVLKKRDVPLIGEVKPLSANPEDVEKFGTQTTGETAGQAANMYLEAGVPGAGKVIGKAFSAFKKALPSVEKTGEVLSGLSRETLEQAAKPEVAKELQQLRSGVLPEAQIPDIPNIPKPAKPTLSSIPDIGPAPGTAEEIKNIGQKAFETAQAQKEAAGKAYGEARRAIIDAKEGKLLQRSKDFVTKTTNALEKEGISIVDGKVDLTGSQFEGSDGAKGFFQRVHSIMTRPVAKTSGKSVADDLLTRREALSNVINDIPPDQANLRRVVGNMREAFDSTLDDILGESASKARKAYATTMEKTKPVISSMTKIENGKRVFSEDKAHAFINSALKESKFDNTRMLEELDTLAGTSHAKDVSKIEEGRMVYERTLSKNERRVAEINAKAKQEYEAAKASREKTLIEAKRVRDVAKAEEKAKLDALKQLNKTLSQTSPELQGKMFDVVRKYATQIPILKNIATFTLTPKFWGDIAINKGLKAASGSSVASKGLSEAQLWFLSNLLTMPTRAGLSTVSSQTEE